MRSNQSTVFPRTCDREVEGEHFTSISGGTIAGGCEGTSVAGVLVSRQPASRSTTKKCAGKRANNHRLSRSLRVRAISSRNRDVGHRAQADRGSGKSGVRFISRRLTPSARLQATRAEAWPQPGLRAYWSTTRWRASVRGSSAARRRSGAQHASKRVACLRPHRPARKSSRRRPRVWAAVSTSHQYRLTTKQPVD